MSKQIRLLTVLLTLITVSCAAPTAAPAPTDAPPTATRARPTATPTPTLAPGQAEVILMAHDSFAASEAVIAEFEKANNAQVRLLKAGDAGKALNQALLTKNNPLADAFFGVDNTFLSRALKADLFAPYQAQGLDKIPVEFKLDAQNRVTPIDYGDVCLNYDKRWFAQRAANPPATLDDLTRPEFKGLLVVQNPATSSPGLSFLLATVANFGADKYLDYWKKLRANAVLVTEGWSDAYYNKSTWGGKGDRPIVLSYATSPAAEVFFSGGKAPEPPTGNVLGDNACFRQIEFAGVLSGAKNPQLAQKLIDYMLTPRFQEDVPAQMFVFPVNPAAQLPDFYKFAERPKQPASLNADTLDANRDKWINEWTNAVLR